MTTACIPYCMTLLPALQGAPLVLLGWSLGGAAALEAAGRLVCECPHYTTLYRMYSCTALHVTACDAHSESSYIL